MVNMLFNLKKKKKRIMALLDLTVLINYKYLNLWMKVPLSLNYICLHSVLVLRVYSCFFAFLFFFVWFFFSSTLSTMNYNEEQIKAQVTFFTSSSHIKDLIYEMHFKLNKKDSDAPVHHVILINQIWCDQPTHYRCWSSCQKMVVPEHHIFMIWKAWF